MGQDGTGGRPHGGMTAAFSGVKVHHRQPETVAAGDRVNRQFVANVHSAVVADFTYAARW